MSAVATTDAAVVAPARLRRGYIDWLRGVAILVMVEAHTLDAWMRAADRATPGFVRGQILGGFAAPLFLFLAGAAVVLSASAKARTSDVGAASRLVQRRGWQILLFAWLFRLQAMVLSHGSPRGLLKVDILNIMGPSIVVAAAAWGMFRTSRSRAIAFAILTALLSVATPAVRGASWIAALPDPFEAYLRPAGGLTSFCIFPWAGFVTAGALVGVLLENARTVLQERRLNIVLTVAGASLALAGYLLSFLPPVFENARFWTSSPTFFLLRTGILVFCVGAAYAWERLAGDDWSAVREFGRSSLFVYWIHIEMVYGPLSSFVHRGLSLPQWLAAYALFVLLLYALTVAKNDVVSRWRGFRAAEVDDRGPQAYLLRLRRFPALGRLRIPEAHHGPAASSGDAECSFPRHAGPSRRRTHPSGTDVRSGSTR